MILTYWSLNGRVITLTCESHLGRITEARSLSNSIRYVMCQKGFIIIDYIDDYVRMGIPNIMLDSYHALIDLMVRLGITISQNKLVPPATQVMCLGVLIDMVHRTIAIPLDKLPDIAETVQVWRTRDVASKCQLQSPCPPPRHCFKFMLLMG